MKKNNKKFKVYVKSPSTADRVIYDPKLTKNEISSFSAAI